MSWRGRVEPVTRPQARGARMAFGLFLVLVLVAAGSSGTRALPATPAVGAASLVDSAVRVAGDEARVPSREHCPAGVGGRRAEPRPTAAWRDLRTGGLPAPRAPDRAAASASAT